MATREEVNAIVEKIRRNNEKKLTNCTNEEEVLLNELLKNGCLKSVIRSIDQIMADLSLKRTSDGEYEAYIIDMSKINEIYK